MKYGKLWASYKERTELFMKQKIVFGAMKNLLCCLAIILPIQFTSNLDTVRNNLSGISIKKETKQKDIDKVVLLSLDKDYCDARCYLNENEKTVYPLFLHSQHALLGNACIRTG